MIISLKILWICPCGIVFNVNYTCELSHSAMNPLSLCWNNQVKEEFMSKSCEIKLNCEVNLVSTSDKGE